MLFQKTLEKMRKNEGGFTLIELLVVMIIIGILAAVAIPVFLSQKDKAHGSAVQSDLRNAAINMEAAYVDNGTYPTDGALPTATTNVVITKSTPQAGGYCLTGTWSPGGTVDTAVGTYYLSTTKALNKDSC